jgi:hypothetical protein
MRCTVVLMALRTSTRGARPFTAQIVQLLSKTSCHGYTVRMRDIFAIEIPSERAAFTANTFGSNLVLPLTHGTNNANVRHILHGHGAGSGLRLPRTDTHGWILGPGIYFANVASKSAQDCRGRSGSPRMMFLAETAWTLPGSTCPLADAQQGMAEPGAAPHPRSTVCAKRSRPQRAAWAAWSAGS